jgi:hypothetical protein
MTNSSRSADAFGPSPERIRIVDQILRLGREANSPERQSSGTASTTSNRGTTVRGGGASQPEGGVARRTP